MDLLTRLFGAATAGVSPAEAQARLNQKNKPFILDVRQPEEFRSGHIPGARLIPLGELPRRLKELPKDQEILCVCRSGNRSATATRQLIAAGYKAFNLQGGMLAWAQAGLPVKKERA